MPVFACEAQLAELVPRVLSLAGSSSGGPPRETAHDAMAMAAGRDYTASESTCTRLGVVSRDWGSRVREVQRMRAHVTLRPGHTGTKHLCDPYGDPLVCVRSRDDEARQRRLTTVEVSVDETPWHPQRPASKGAGRVGVRVARQEVSLQRQVQLAGGRWHPRRRVWELRRDEALTLGLHERIAHAKVAIRRNQ
jgi:hypothetical protein